MDAFLVASRSILPLVLEPFAIQLPVIPALTSASIAPSFCRAAIALTVPTLVILAGNPLATSSRKSDKDSKTLEDTYCSFEQSLRANPEQYRKWLAKQKQIGRQQKKELDQRLRYLLEREDIRDREADQRWKAYLDSQVSDPQASDSQ